MGAGDGLRASMLRPCCAAATVWPFPQHNLLPAFLASVAEHARLTAPGLSAFPHGNPISTIPVAPDANSAARRPMANMAKNEPREGPLAAGEPPHPHARSDSRSARLARCRC